MRSMRVLVVGRGIGGLSAALALLSTPTPTHLEWSMTNRLDMMAEPSQRTRAMALGATR
jgi:hypothetical protein